MKGIRLSLLIIASLLIASCSKLDMEFLVNTYWTGTMTSSDAPEMSSDLSFEFDKGKADFTYLPYGEQYPEKGVMLYSISDGKMTIQSANEILDGVWNISKENNKTLYMTQTADGKTFTIRLDKRR